jgi:hypothetical protein
MAILNNTQEAQKKQGDEVKSLSERINHIENYKNENEYENYDDNNQEPGEENKGITEPPPKKQRQDTNINTSKFSSMAKRKYVIVR